MLESFLCSVRDKEVSSSPSGETDKNVSTNAVIFAKGHADALSALAELRRIGDILIHMRL